MGFYDDQPQFPSPKKKKSSTILTALISAIIGGLIALLLMPFIQTSGLKQDANPSQSTINIGSSETTSVTVNSDITKAVNKTSPAVVGVLNLKQSQDLFSRESVQQGTGSGVIISKENGKAIVVTNNHVIEGGTEFKVTIPAEDNKNHTVNAKVLGADSLSDLAVLEIDDQYVTKVAEFGDSDTLQAGEPAIAIGNPLGLGQSVTVGIISSPQRTIEVTKDMSMTVMQTDAAINPGNSGGALINAAGQLIGINTLKITETGVEGLGFAIPINEARPIIENLIKHGEVPRPFVGITMVPLSQLTQEHWDILSLPRTVEDGVVINEVFRGTPADKAGLQYKDVIVALDDEPITSSMDLREYLYKEKNVGDQISVTYYRNGKKNTVDLTLTKNTD
ncbi:serine protease [Hazenella sp. IB182353]|uniref:S1C family serine protease n=1 Tax=Polycladospora coralii TaxID=2771432 RepID=UPI001746409C|nr:S1C family serine protease [Polycladospora coralii]MBS7530511.1 serine protease [Polycladospora coralii]